MSSLFTEQDLGRLEDSMRLRQRLLNNFAKRKDDDLPVKPSELMAVTALADSVDRSIFSKVKLEIDQGAVDNEKATRDVLKQLLLDLHENNSNAFVVAGTPLDSPPVYESRTTIPVSEGELIRKNDSGLDAEIA